MSWSGQNRGFSGARASSEQNGGPQGPCICRSPPDPVTCQSHPEFSFSEHLSCSHCEVSNQEGALVNGAAEKACPGHQSQPELTFLLPATPFLSSVAPAVGSCPRVSWSACPAWLSLYTALLLSGCNPSVEDAQSMSVSGTILNFHLMGSQVS